MKIVALLPVKNESLVLPSYLSSVVKVADEIIALDDSSTDSSVAILEEANAKVITFDSGKESIVNMSARRQKLLEAGRQSGGTHFIWLDADETFSANFIPNARALIEKLRPGQKITMRWVHAWKNTDEFLNDAASPFGYIWKDFIVCDDTECNFESKFLSEARTNCPNDSILKLPEEQGVVLHWQFSQWENVQLKQAYYRCTELIKGERSARRINHTYGITLENPNYNTQSIPTEWTSGLEIPKSSQPTSWHLEKIVSYFNSQGIEFFEPLQIWHIPELRDIFFTKKGHEPQAQVFPSWLIYLNKLKNKIHL